jgi:hypothetical protein
MPPTGQQASVHAERDRSDAEPANPAVRSDQQRNGTIVQSRVAVLEYLPRTPANLRLLSLTARHPAARVEVGAASKAAGGGK